MLPAMAIALLVTVNVATAWLPERWYVPICVVSVLALLLLGTADGLTPADMGLGVTRLVPGLALAVVIVVLAAVVVYSAAVLLPWTRPAFSEERATTAGGRDIAWRVLVAIPLGTVLLEETAFRGVLFAMAARHGAGWAVAVTSALFGAWHIIPAWRLSDSHAAIAATLGDRPSGRAVAILLAMAFTGVAGVVFGVLRLVSGSLLPAASLHWAANGTGVTVAWLLGRHARVGAEGTSSARDEAPTAPPVV